MRIMCFARVVSLSVTMLGGVALAADDGGLTVPAGFTVTVVQEGLGAGRHLAVADNGDIYLASRNGLVAMRDKNGDGKVDETAKFGDVQGTGVRIHRNWLYVSDDVGVYRYPLKKGELAPSGARQTVVAGFPKERQHADKTFALDANGTLYVNVGAPSNSCQEKDRQEGSLGRNPCPILDNYGGVWVFDGNKLDQTPANGRRFATGMRNAVALQPRRTRCTRSFMAETPSIRCSRRCTKPRTTPRARARNSTRSLMAAITGGRTHSSIPSSTSA
jgi:glucose/arabinose dehydrogenase